MEVTVSIPDDLFERAERLRRREGRSRSDVYREALSVYVALHAPEEVTEAINRVCDALGTEPDDFIQAASLQILEQVE